MRKRRGRAGDERITAPDPYGLGHPGARSWSPRWGRIGALLTLLIPLAMMLTGWALRGLPNLPLPQSRPGRLPEAHWEQRISLPTPRAAFAAANVGGRLWLLGGEGGANGRALDSVSIYNATYGRWEFGPALSAPRSDLSAAVLGQLLYVAGGRDGDGVEVATVEVLDSVTGGWRRVAPLPSPRAGLGLVALDGRLYAIGGHDAGAPLAAVDIYDPATDTWRSAPPLPTARQDLAAVALGGRIFAVGGDEGGKASASVDVLDTASGNWSAGPPLLAPLTGITAAVYDGRLHAVGGAVQQVYEPRANVWLAGEPPIVARDGARLVAADNLLYLVGGIPAGDRVEEGGIELYEPGPAPQEDPFRLVGVNRGGSIAVVSGLLVTVLLSVVALKAGRRRPQPPPAALADDPNDEGTSAQAASDAARDADVGQRSEDGKVVDDTVPSNMRGAADAPVAR